MFVKITARWPQDPDLLSYVRRKAITPNPELTKYLDHNGLKAVNDGERYDYLGVVDIPDCTIDAFNELADLGRFEIDMDASPISIEFHNAYD